MFPARNIISVDIGGTLAKTAFYVPKHHRLNLEKAGKFDSLTKDSIPSKYSVFFRRPTLIWFG